MLKPKKRIIAISGSIRANSTSNSILKIIATLFHETLELQIVDIIQKLPHFNQDLDNDQIDLNVIEFRKLIDEADGVIICTPEYVFSLPGTLKNALEWTVSTTVFLNKPTSLIVASGLGEKAFESLILIMKTLGANINTDSNLLIQGAKSKLNDDRQIVDQAIINKLELLVSSLSDSI